MKIDFFLSNKKCNNVIQFRCNDSTFKFMHNYCKWFGITLSDLLRNSLAIYFDDPEFLTICDQIDFNLDD